ncbi:MAG: hypothetical protein WAL58_16765 [Terriglobales bacterium]
MVPVEVRGVRKLAKYWGGWFTPLGDGDVKETNLNIFYHFGDSLRCLQEHIQIGVSASSVLADIVLAREWLESFIFETREFHLALKDSRTSAQAILRVLLDIYTNLPHDYARTLTQAEVWLILSGKEELEKNFEREHRSLSVFTVTPKGIYDTRLLIEMPELKFPEQIRASLPKQMLYDLRQAGRCLAFEIPTACAFHVCRGTEAVMLQYYELLAKQPWPHKKKDWKIYVEQLCVKGAPKQITNRLEEIRVLDRNAYVHPDVNVTLEEAPNLFELCTNVVSLMGLEMSKLTP